MFDLFNMFQNMCLCWSRRNWSSPSRPRTPPSFLFECCLVLGGGRLCCSQYTLPIYSNSQTKWFYFRIDLNHFFLEESNYLIIIYLTAMTYLAPVTKLFLCHDISRPTVFLFENPSAQFVARVLVMNFPYRSNTPLQKNVPST